MEELLSLNINRILDYLKITTKRSVAVNILFLILMTKLLFKNDWDIIIKIPFIIKLFNFIPTSQLLSLANIFSYIIFTFLILSVVFERLNKLCLVKQYPYYLHTDKLLTITEAIFDLLAISCLLFLITTTKISIHTILKPPFLLSLISVLENLRLTFLVTLNKNY